MGGMQQALLSRGLQQMDAARDAFAMQQRAPFGWGERLAALDRLKLTRFQVMATFEVSRAVAARLEAHLQSWLQERSA